MMGVDLSCRLYIFSAKNGYASCHIICLGGDASGEDIIAAH